MSQQVANISHASPPASSGDGEHPVYLLVTHIPFSRTSEGEVIVDSLWARDIEGLSTSGFRIRICAPQVDVDQASGWGPGSTSIHPGEDLDFIGFPAIHSRRDLWRWPQIRRILRAQVAAADLVHTSNFFPPYLGLSSAHYYAIRSGKPTIFVIAEDFYDMLEWEWVRTAPDAAELRKRRQTLSRLDELVRSVAQSASLTFLHTPAAVERYRNSAANGIPIRQPNHERDEVISEESLQSKCQAILSGCPLRIVAACRHKPLKGLDLLIQAIHLLRAEGIETETMLYGEGPQTPELRGLIDSLGMADCVQLPGVLQPGAEVYRSIAAGHLFAMPHRSTDFGRAFFDAMAAASPVVAFRTAASLGTVRDGVDGLLAPIDDVEALAEIIARFHHDREFLVRCSLAARHRAIHNTRSFWYSQRAAWTMKLLNESRNHG
jgi:glycosyltransferase involved in cell wall biosynthesis